MSEHPIIFSGPMVRAILEGRKTQTRRVFKQMADANARGGWLSAMYWRRDGSEWWASDRGVALGPFRCPYGIPGDRLWTKEGLERGTASLVSWRNAPWAGPRRDGEFVAWDDCGWKRDWLSPIHMPRWACRLILEVKSVRVERVQEISQVDARAEGCDASWLIHKPSDDVHNARRDTIYEKYGRPVADTRVADERDEFAYLWDSINKARGYGWESNPFVWVVEFEKEQP